MSDRFVRVEGPGVIITDLTKVAIVGAGPGREAAPFDDPEWVVFALNEIAQPRFDVHFELHPRAVQSPRDMYCLRNISSPTYVIDPSEWAPGEVPNAVRYPIESVLRTFGRRYFTCTFAYQLALALWCGFETVGVWGCGLYNGTARERLVEKGCLDYWIGRAEGLGVRVVEDSMLAHQPHLYGYAYDLEVQEVNRQVGLMHDVLHAEGEMRSRGVDPNAHPSDV